MNPQPAEPPADSNPTPSSESGAATTRATLQSLPRSRPFQRFWCTRVLSSLSFQMLAVAMGWHIYATANIWKDSEERTRVHQKR